MQDFSFEETRDDVVFTKHEHVFATTTTSLQLLDPSSPGLYIYVSSWGEGLAGWSIALSELLVIAQRLNATFVEPCISSGRLMPCGGGRRTQLRLGQVFDTLPFQPFMVSHDEFKMQTGDGAAARFRICMGPQSVCSSQKVANVTNFGMKKSSTLENAISMGRTSKAILEVTNLRKDAFRQIVLQGDNNKDGPLVHSAAVTKTKLKLLNFKQEHIDNVVQMLDRLGVGAHDSYSVIQWRAERDGIDYMECARAILNAKQVIMDDPRSRGISPSTKFILVSSLSTHQHLQWAGAKQKSANSTAGEALRLLLDSPGFYKLDTVINASNVTDMIYLVIWDILVSMRASYFATCSDCAIRCHYCTKCNYEKGKFPKLMMELRQTIGKTSDSCWPTGKAETIISRATSWVCTLLRLK